MHEVLVVGAGIAGLCTANALRRRGVDVALVEARALGHGEGSSHGQSRITRTAYLDAVYVEIMTRAHAELWPRLEAEAGERLLFPCDVVIGGPAGGDWPQYEAALRGAEVAVTCVSGAEAAERYPMLRFGDALGVAIDRTGGVLAAENTRAALRRLLANTSIYSNRAVTGLREGPASVTVETEQGPLQARQVAVCAGPWTDTLLPGLRLALRPVAQDVHYLDLDLPAGAQELGAFPAWYWLGAGVDGEAYGLPAFGRPGVKLARYKTSGRDEVASERPLREAEGPVLAAERLVPAVRAALGAERCWFTVAPGFDPVIDRLSPRVVAFAGGSGHAFKLGPTVGELLAQLLHGDHTDEPTFDRNRARFSAARR